MTEPITAPLFAPASRHELIGKALSSRADIVVDLEDAIAPDDKPAACGVVAELQGAPIWQARLGKAVSATMEVRLMSEPTPALIS